MGLTSILKRQNELNLLIIEVGGEEESAPQVSQEGNRMGGGFH